MTTHKRFLGDLNAATDQDFKSHFVESSDLTHILSNESDIIYGSKGVGKTALQRALTEINQDFFFSTNVIDLENLGFESVHNALSRLKDATDTDISTLSRNTWRNILAMYCLEAVKEELSDSHPLKAKITRILVGENFNESDSNNRILNQIESFFVRIAELGLEERTVTQLSLTPQQRLIVNSFPSNDEIQQCLEESTRIVKESGKYVLVCLDGFDSIVDHTPESRKAIFSGLIDAIHKCSKDKLFSDAFCFKAFLPQELTDEAIDVIWDADKHIYNTHYLRWTEEDFQRFLKKRLQIFSKVKSNNFSDIWYEYMPNKIHNSTHRIEEPSFSYILRHTLYRPRQLLAHLQIILDKWDEVSDKFKVDPSFIPHVVANTNYELARGVVNQLEIKYFGLSSFMQSWSGIPSTILVEDFQDRMRKILGYSTINEINNVFNDMFNFGIFGIAPKTGLIKGSQQTRFRFGFVGDRFSRNIHAGVEAKDILGISPMFHEYCGCLASEYGAIIPTDK